MNWMALSMVGKKVAIRRRLNALIPGEWEFVERGWNVPRRDDIAMDPLYAQKGYRGLVPIRLHSKGAATKVRLFVTDKPVFGRDEIGIHSFGSKHLR